MWQCLVCFIWRFFDSNYEVAIRTSISANSGHVIRTSISANNVAAIRTSVSANNHFLVIKGDSWALAVVCALLNVILVVCVYLFTYIIHPHLIQTKVHR